jgi:8-oxo-dGTP diphosphatase
VRYPRIVRVAELIRLSEIDVRPAAGRLPRRVSVVTAELNSGTLVTLELRRPWWDRRPRRLVLGSLSRVLARIRSRQDVVVVAAAIRRQQRVLIGQRAAPPDLAGCWEFPGGKVEMGETLEAAIVRECREELDVSIAVGAELARQTLGDGAQLVLFAAEIDPAVEPRAVEHRELRWVAAGELVRAPLLPANLTFIPQVTNWLESSIQSQPGRADRATGPAYRP